MYFIAEAHVSEFRAWVRRARGGDVMVVTSFSPGVGVSHMIQHVISGEGMEPVPLLAGGKTKAFLTDASTSVVTVDFKHKVLVLDPMDALLSDVTAGVELLDFLKAACKLPIVAAGFLQRSSRTRLLSALPKKTTVVTALQVTSLDEDAVRRYLRAQAPSADSLKIEAAWQAAYGDVRAAAHSLRLGLGDAKDRVVDGVEAIEALLYSRPTVADAIRMQHGDVNMVTMGVFENYLRVTKDLDACVAVADAYSHADIVDECMYGKQQWDLDDLYGALSAATPAVCIRDARKTAGVSIEKFGTQWSRNNNQRSKEKVMRGVAHDFLMRGIQIPVQDMTFLRDIVSSMCARADYAGVADLARSCGLSQASLLDLMRASVHGASYTCHARIKKLMAVRQSAEEDPPRRAEEPRE